MISGSTGFFFPLSTQHWSVPYRFCVTHSLHFPPLKRFRPLACWLRFHLISSYRSPFFFFIFSSSSFPSILYALTVSLQALLQLGYASCQHHLRQRTGIYRPCLFPLLLHHGLLFYDDIFYCQYHFLMSRSLGRNSICTHVPIPLCAHRIGWRNFGLLFEIERRVVCNPPPRNEERVLRERLGRLRLRQYRHRPGVPLQSARFCIHVVWGCRRQAFVCQYWRSQLAVWCGAGAGAEDILCDIRDQPNHCRHSTPNAKEIFFFFSIRVVCIYIIYIYIHGRCYYRMTFSIWIFFLSYFFFFRWTQILTKVIRWKWWRMKCIVPNGCRPFLGWIDSFASSYFEGNGFVMMRPASWLRHTWCLPIHSCM